MWTRHHVDGRSLPCAPLVDGREDGVVRAYHGHVPSLHGTVLQQGKRVEGLQLPAQLVHGAVGHTCAEVGEQLRRAAHASEEFAQLTAVERVVGSGEYLFGNSSETVDGPQRAVDGHAACDTVVDAVGGYGRSVDAQRPCHHAYLAVGGREGPVDVEVAVVPDDGDVVALAPEMAEGRVVHGPACKYEDEPLITLL